MNRSRSDFVDYCLRALGAPVIEINVDDEQVDDRVDEALQVFQQFHSEAVERVFHTHIISNTDKTNGYLTIGYPILSVIDIPYRGYNQESFGNPIWHIKQDAFMALNFPYGNNGSLVPYLLTTQRLADIEYIFGSKPRLQYNQNSNRLYIEEDWSNVDVGDVVVLEVYKIVDPESNEDVWNDIWLKRYATALIGRQWALNMSKFQDIKLPGGMTLNGAELFSKYNDQIVSLEEEVQTKWQYPTSFSMG